MMSIQPLNWFYGSRQRIVRHIFRTEREELVWLENHLKYRCRVSYKWTPRRLHFYLEQGLSRVLENTTLQKGTERVKQLFCWYICFISVFENE